MIQSRYKISLILAGALLAVLLGSFPAQASGPQIVVDTAYWDFGFVPFDYNLIHYYTIKNAGDENLYITRLSSSCDCTYGHPGDTLIPPGGSTRIKANFSTKDYYGKNTRTIGVYTNDPNRPEYDLEFGSLIGALPKYVAAQPNALFFLPPHKEKEVKLINNSQSNITVSFATEPDSIITLDLPAKNIDIEGGGEYVIIRVIPRENLPGGTHLTSFTVDFGTTPPVRITIPVKIVRY